MCIYHVCDASHRLAHKLSSVNQCVTRLLHLLNSTRADGGGKHHILVAPRFALPFFADGGAPRAARRARRGRTAQHRPLVVRYDAPDGQRPAAGRGGWAARHACAAGISGARTVLALFCCRPAAGRAPLQPPPARLPSPHGRSARADSPRERRAAGACLTPKRPPLAAKGHLFPRAPQARRPGTHRNAHFNAPVWILGTCCVRARRRPWVETLKHLGGC